jgi:hypothetical protein
VVKSPAVKQRIVLLISLLVLCLPAFGGQRGRSSSRSYSSRSYSSRSHSSGSKPVHVSGYRRKGGTYVQPHDRSYPGTAVHTRTPRTYYGSAHLSNPSTAVHTRTPRTYYGSTHRSTTHTTRAPSINREHRSVAAKDSFKRQHPCPATGKSTGACPGYVIDHTRALACGGADAPSNMQWQTVAAGKAKDKWERNGCR